MRKVSTFEPENPVVEMSEYHTPVLLKESVDLLAVRPGGTYVDLTFGGGGHSSLILSRLQGCGHLYSFDQDADAQACARALEADNFTFVRSNFRFLRGALRLRGAGPVDGILADLGVSSHHFDALHRGFSFRGDATLDMRMNASAAVSAADVVNGYDVQQLTRVLLDWGELEGARRVAEDIAAARSTEPILTTEQLVGAVQRRIPPRDRNGFLSRLFQALRIEVNGEMQALEMALEQSLKVLAPGGRLVVISYHSLEDRMVKNFMRSGSAAPQPEKDFFGRSSSPWRIITRKAVRPDGQEQQINPRSRSARLRAAEKIEMQND